MCYIQSTESVVVVIAGVTKRKFKCDVHPFAGIWNVASAQGFVLASLNN